MMTWYPGKQNTMTFNGKEDESFREILVSVLDTNGVIKQINSISDSPSQKTTKISIESERIIDNSLICNQKLGLVNP